MKSNAHLTLAQLYKQNAGKVLATLVRLLGDFDLAEEAMHEAFATALEQWQREGVPSNPTAWLISTGRFKAIDLLRRRTRLGELQPELQQQADEIEAHNDALAQRDIEDDQLRLIFTCCHPSIAPKIQIPLTLREVCGLTTEEIASAFLISPATLAQRIVRGKAKIREAGIPFELPDLLDLPERLDAVLSVIYLIFNEGYSASSGTCVTRAELSVEAIRLARLLLNLLPNPEVQGLLALMLLHESRREARTDSNGDIVLLEDQNRKYWNRQLISEGLTLVNQVLATRRIGSYTLQAAIAAEHAKAATASATDWHQICALYTLLLQVVPSPVIELNRAAAIAMRDGPEAGLALIEGILQRGDLGDYHLLHSARAELLRRSGQNSAALQAFEQALTFCQQAPEQRLLQRKIDALRVRINP